MVRERGISIVEGKNVALIGFGKLAETELKTVKNIMSTYIRKIEGRTDYSELRIKLRLHQHLKSFMHELEAELFIPGRTLSAKATHKNLYKALALTGKKLLSKISHLKKKSQREKPIRKLFKKL